MKPPLLIVTGLAAACLLAWLWLRPGAGLPTLDRAQLAALEATEADRDRLVVHLGSRLLDGDTWRSWRELDEPSRHLFATASVEQEVATEGGIAMLARRADDAAMPGFSAAAAGYAAIGCPALSALCERAATAPVPADEAPPWAEHFRTSFEAQLPAARNARIAYLREHLDLVAP